MAMDIDDSIPKGIEEMLGESHTLWDAFMGYADKIEGQRKVYFDSIKGYSPSTWEQAQGLLDWVRRTKGSYESKLWEMEVLLWHMMETNVVTYLGYDTKTHPDVAVVNTKTGTAVAIEVKQVESQEQQQVHVNLYKAFDQLYSRVYFDPVNKQTPYTRWKAYIYINSGNPWPATKPADLGKTFDTLMLDRIAEHKKSSHWTQWSTVPDAKIDISIWHADHPLRYNYTLS